MGSLQVPDNKRTFGQKVYDRYTALVGGALSLVSPARAGSFVASRDMYRSFVSGSSHDSDRNWRPRMRSGDAEVKAAMRLTADRCRDQAQNNPMISGGIARIADNVVRAGIYPKFKFLKSNGDLDREANKAWRKMFIRWARYCDITAHDTYGSLQKLGVRHMWMDGQYFIHRVYNTTKKNIVPLRLELLEFDQLDKYVDGVQENGNIARKGIEYNKNGEPVFYHFLAEHPGDYLYYRGISETQRFQAKDIIHVWDRQRISQCSGISWLHAIVLEAYRNEDFRHLTSDKARIEATFAAFLRSSIPGFQLGAGLGFGGQSSPAAAADTGAKEAPLELTSGVIQKLPTGTEMQFQPQSTPGNNYVPFTNDSKRQQASGMRQAFESYANDRSDSSYTAALAGSLEERISYGGQQLFLEEQCNRGVIAWFIEAAYLAGMAPHPMQGYADDPDYYHELAEGQFPGWQGLNASNDATAAEKRIDLVIDTHHNQSAQIGNDFDDVVETQMDEVESLIELEKKKAELKKIKELNEQESE